MENHINYQLKTKEDKRGKKNTKNKCDVQKQLKMGEFNPTISKATCKWTKQLKAQNCQTKRKKTQLSVIQKKDILNIKTADKGKQW